MHNTHNPDTSLILVALFVRERFATRHSFRLRAFVSTMTLERLLSGGYSDNTAVR